MANFVSHVWKPSKARYIVIDDFVPNLRGALSSSPVSLSWPPKDPSDILDYQANIEPVIAGNEGDCIEGIEIDINPNLLGDLSVNSVSADGHLIVIWMSGGQVGIDYNVTLKVNLASGRMLQRTILLPVVALSSPSLPFNAIQTTNHDMLNDQNGNPILN